MRGSQNLKGHVTPPPISYDLVLHSFCWGPLPSVWLQNFNPLASSILEKCSGTGNNFPQAPFPLCGGSRPLSNTMFHGSPGVFTPNSILICSAVFAVKPNWSVWQTDGQTYRPAPFTSVTGIFLHTSYAFWSTLLCWFIIINSSGVVVHFCLWEWWRRAR